MTKPTARDFLLVQKDIQNKMGRPIGYLGKEDRHFRDFFGAGPFTVTNLWNMMVDCDGLEGEIKHLLWTLHFLKAYPKQAAVCSTVGGSTGVIDPKTFWKHMCSFICAVAELKTNVVSKKYPVCYDIFV